MAVKSSVPSSLTSASALDSYNETRDGYNVEDFVKKPSQSCICPYCKKVLRSPHTIECGHRFCHGCLNKIIESDKAVCPVKDCEEPINQEEIVKDHASRREIESLLVYCDAKNQGCPVTIKLKELRKHQAECSYRKVECPHCGETMQKEELDHHLQKCFSQKSVCTFSDYGCEFKGSGIDLENHMSSSTEDHLDLIKNSHSKLEFKCAQLERRCTELQNQKSIVENRFKQQLDEFNQTKQTVAQLEEKLSKLESQNNTLDDKVRDSHKIVATQIDRMMKIEQDMTQKAKTDDIEECKNLHLAVQATCRRVEERVERLEYDQPAMVRVAGRSTNAADIEEIRKTLAQIGTQLGMHDVRLAEQDLRFQVVETACFDGVLIWKIKDYVRRKHEAVIGKTMSLYSQPFYTSKYGYKMCARVYLNGDGMGKGTHMSLFFVVMRGDYDQLLTWPFRQKVTLVLMDQDTGRRNLSDTFRPDPTSTSFKRPTADMNVASGCPLFVSQSVLETPTYVKNDTLFMKMIVDTSDLYGP